MNNIYVEKTICGKKDKWLELSNLKINKLPKGFKCLGSLDCDGSSLEELPENLIVKGNLYIGNSNITVLPKKLIICGDLILLNSSIFTLPSDICICGSIIALHVDNPPSYIKNTIYENFVCDTNGVIIPFVDKHIIGLEPVPGRRRNHSITLFLGVINNQDAVAYEGNNGLVIRSCSSFREGKLLAEKDFLKQSEYYTKYYNYDIKKKRFVKELVEIFQDITNSCEKGVDGFFKLANISINNKYSIEEGILLLKKVIQDPNNLLYINLFEDYFYHRETFEKL